MRWRLTSTTSASRVMRDERPPGVSTWPAAISKTPWASVLPSPAPTTSVLWPGVSSLHSQVAMPKAKPGLSGGWKSSVVRVAVQRTAAPGIAPPNR